MCAEKARYIEKNKEEKPVSRTKPRVSVPSRHAYILLHDSCSRDCIQLVWILFVIIRNVCHITSKMGKTIAKLLCIGSFAGA